MSASNRISKALEAEFGSYPSNENSVIMKICLSIFIVILGVCGMYAQKPGKSQTVYGSGIEMFSSGNGHGAFYAINATISKGRGTVFAGPMMHARTNTFSGIKLSYSGNLSGLYNQYTRRLERDLLQLNYFVYAQYNKKTGLCGSLINEECRILGAEEVAWEKVSMSTMETGAGIGFQLNIGKYISWKNRIAAGVYYHPENIEHMAHEAIAPTLHLGTGIYLSF